MNRFNVIVYAIRRRRGRRRPFEVRWRAAGRPRSKSCITGALADSYRAELVRAARKGLEFDPQTGEPVLWAEPEPVTVTWYRHAAAYAAITWPALAAHSRSSVAQCSTAPWATRSRRATELRPGRLDQLAGPQGGHRRRAEGRGQSRAGRGHARRRGPDPPGSGGVLRLLVLRRAAPGRSHRLAPSRLPPAPPGLADRAQRKQVRPHLAHRPRTGPRARSGCHCSCPPPLRPATRRAIALAERRCRNRPDRATSRAQPRLDWPGALSYRVNNRSCPLCPCRNWCSAWDSNARRCYGARHS
jgi:hypothetical protein